MKPIKVTTEITNAESLLAKAEVKARELLAEAAVKDEERHQIRLAENQKTIIETIDKTVNGKIDKVTKKFDEYVLLDMKWKEEDRKWKDGAQPVVSFYKGTTFWTSWAGKRIVDLAKLVILTGATFGAYTVIRNFFIKCVEACTK